MKSRSFFFGCLLLPAAALISFSGSALALTFTKANNTTAISSAGSWVGGLLPGTADTILFDGTITTAITTANLGNVTFASIQVTSPGGLVTIGTGASTLTLGTGGIDMSTGTGDFTLGTTANTGFIRMASGNFGVTLNVAAGRTLTFNSQFTNQGNTKTATFTGGGNIVFNGSAGAGGAMSFDITGGTNVTLNGTGSWATGNDVINGTLNIGNDTALGSNTLGLGGTSSTTPTLTASGGARTIANNINLNSVTTGNATITGTNALTVNGVLTVAGGDRTLTVNNTALTTFGTGGVALANSVTNRTLTINGSGNTTISGVVVNGNISTASNLTYSGSGLLSLSNANTFAGTLTATSGTTRIDNTLAAQNATVSVGAANAVTFGTGITTATFGGLSGAGNLALTNTDTNAVVLSVGNNNASTTYSGALSGSGSLTKIGSGTLSVSNTGNAVNYLVTGGTLRGSGTSANTNGGFGTGAIELQGGTLTAAMSSSNTLSFGNALTVATGQTGTFTTPERMTWSGNVSGAGTFNIGVTTTFSRLDLHNSWTGFTGNANFTGSGGVRLFNNGGTFNTASFQSTALDLGGSVGFQPQTNSGGNTYQIGALSGSSATASLGGGTAGRATYSVGALNTSTSFAGAINGNSALTKTGSGTQTLTGSSSYTGATTITGGTLALSGTASISSSTNIIVGASTTFDVSAVTGGYTLASVQTISGTGTVAGAMSVSGTLSPGNSPGTLTTGSQAWLVGGDYNWQILDASGSAGTGYDTISITGTLDLTNLTTANYAINLWSLSSISPDVNGNALNFSDVSSYSWVLASTSGGVTGFDAADFVINTGANNGAAGFSNTFTGNFAVGVSGNNLVLNYTAVPEPRVALLGGLGLLALLRRRRYS